MRDRDQVARLRGEPSSRFVPARPRWQVQVYRPLRLDGTLLRSDGSISISERTRRTLHRVREAGCEVVVTARARPWLVAALDATGIDLNYAVSSNGAVVYDVGRGIPFAHHTISGAVAARIVQALREAAPGVAFACERESLTFREPAYVPLWATPGTDDRVDAKMTFAAAPMSSSSCNIRASRRMNSMRWVAGICGEDATPTFSGEVLVEISAAGVTKGYALAGLCEMLGVEASTVIAFGDMPNDIPRKSRTSEANSASTSFL